MTLDTPRLAGVLLILSGIVFAVGRSLPILGDNGNFRIYTLPVREHLVAVAASPLVWRWTNVLMGAAAVVLLVALAMLSAILGAHAARATSWLSLVGFVIAAVLWLMFSAFRGAVTTAAAQETIASGAIPPYYQPLARWALRCS
jgi:hypothetical protein